MALVGIFTIHEYICLFLTGKCRVNISVPWILWNNIYEVRTGWMIIIFVLKNGLLDLDLKGSEDSTRPLWVFIVGELYVTPGTL